MNHTTNEYPHSELTHQIIGIAYEVHNKLGPGYLEKIYQRAIAQKFAENNIDFRKELYCKLELDGKRVGIFYMDFLVDDCVVVEIKARGEIYSKDIAQTLSYMKVHNIKVGIIILFSKIGVKVKRLVL